MATYDHTILGLEVPLIRRFAALGLLVPIMLVPADAAWAAVDCQGTEATFVGQPGVALHGTDGADVIVSNGANFVSAGDGDDLVCMTGRPHGARRVRDGLGDDQIFVEGSWRTWVYVVGGADTVTGGPGAEYVYLGEVAGQPDAEGDVVHTGGGPDHLYVRHLGEVRDRIDLGAGADSVSLAPGNRLAESGELSGGTGHDGLYFPHFQGTDDADQFVVDNGRGIATVDGSVMARWAGFERFGMGGQYLERATFIGSGADEEVRATGSHATFRFDLKSGDDRLELLYSPPAGSTVTGGRGEDRLTLEYVSNVVVDLDVTRGTAVVRSDEDGDVAFAGIERHDVLAGRVTMQGGGGADYFTVGASRAVLRGGAGADRLIGGPGADVLDGGRGRDVGVGRRGRDRCLSVERRTGCEVLGAR
jgi:Ca2+-binding RTX toxin-like protein